MRTFDISIPFENENNDLDINALACENLHVKSKQIKSIKLIKRSLDARKKQIKVNLRFRVILDEDEKEISTPISYPSVKNNTPVHIIGTGPAGLFCALRCIQMGLKPIVFERGKSVKERRRDLANLTKNHVVNEDSNYCFGEGGAGTYSDGKLYTRSKKRGDVDAILAQLIHFGADEQIKVEAHPHIGTNKLPKIIENIREQIIASGGEIHFEKKLIDIQIKNEKVKGIIISKGEEIAIDNLVLATGHSARDIFYLLENRNIKIEAKAFALGVRIEHPQEIINRIQYHGNLNELLPPAAYSLVKQVEGKGVYSFCMCPGGVIAPCATSPGEIVSNGWSPSKRNNPFANSGIVVPVEEGDWKAFSKSGNLSALQFQASIEKAAFVSCNEKGQDSQFAPAQRLIDFVENRTSKDLPGCSYFPGIKSVNLNEILPKFIGMRLKKAFREFGKSMPGYLTNDAIIVGVESRTSSPIRIPRNRDNFQHIDISNLFPCGEGAGYAGGIVSAAIDGVKVAEAIKAAVDA